MKPTLFTILLISIIQIQTFSQIITTVEFNCYIFADSNFTRKTYTLQKFDTVRVSTYYFKTDAYLIIHNNIEGYVYSRKLKNTSGLTVMRRNAILAARNSQQIENKKINKELMSSRPKNNMYVNLFGDASTISLNYERLVLISPSFFFAGKLGIGYRFEDGYFFIFGNSYLTMPYHITANVGLRKHFFEFGMGMTTDLNSQKTYFPNVKTKKYVIVGYRFQPTKPNLRIDHNYFFRVNLLFFTNEGYPSMIPIGISIGKSF